MRIMLEGFEMLGYFKEFFSVMIYILEIMALVIAIWAFKMKTLIRGMYVVKNIANYYSAIIIIFVIVDYVYYILCEKFQGALISSGIVLCILLILGGRLFNPLYKFLKDKTAEDELNESEKQYIWGWSALISTFFISFYNQKVALIALSLFLGKYIWFDTGDSNNNIKEIFKNMKDNEEINHKNIIKIKNWIFTITVIHSIVFKFINTL